MCVEDNIICEQELTTINAINVNMKQEKKLVIDVKDQHETSWTKIVWK